MRYNLETKKDLKFVSGKLYERHHVKAYAETEEEAREMLKKYFEPIYSDETTASVGYKTAPLWREDKKAVFATIYVAKKEKETYFPVLHFEEN